MTTPQLQHAATSPSRFTAYLRQELRPPKNKLPTKLIKPTSFRALPGKHCFERAFLVPGGRYILTMSYTKPCYLIQLWDIGFSVDSVTPSFPVASKRFEEYIVVILGLQPIATGDGLLVMLEITLDNR